MCESDVNISFPIVMIHNKVENLIWICTKNEQSELSYVSVFINKYKNEKIVNEFDKFEDIIKLIDDLKIKGWVKGYMPEIEMKDENNNILFNYKL
uniref:Uncharacterized protein n=1 Tax=viral metagenome TaxID=1070528 RepID=A0A6C0JSH0_9ZZZZ